MVEQSVIDEKAQRRAKAFKDFLDAKISGYTFKDHLAKTESDIGAVASMQDAGEQLLAAYDGMISFEAEARTAGEVKTEIVRIAAGQRTVVLSIAYSKDIAHCDDPVLEAKLVFNQPDESDITKVKSDERKVRGVNDSRVPRQIREFVEAGIEELTAPNTYLASSYRK